MDRNILNNDELKSGNPFSVPEGYFGKIGNIRPWEKVRKEDRKAATALAPYLAMAAMFIIIAAAGTFFFKSAVSGSEDYYLHESSLIYSDLIPVNDMGAIMFDDIQEDGDRLTEEDIIDYLIYSGIPIEYIESEK